MVSSQQEEVFRVLDLVSHHEADDLQVLLSSIDVVSKEQIVRLRWEVADLEDSQQVYELTVDVAGNNKRWVELDQVGLGNKDLLGFLDEHLNLLLSEVDGFDSEVGGICSDILSDLEKGVDDIVELVLVYARHVA